MTRSNNISNTHQKAKGRLFFCQASSIMHGLSSLGGAGACILFLFLATAGWMAPAARAQSLVNAVTLSASGNNDRWPAGAGCTSSRPATLAYTAASPYTSSYSFLCPPCTDAKGYAYFCTQTGPSTGSVYKVATGNANGPSSTAPSEVNRLTISYTCYDGVVRLST